MSQCRRGYHQKTETFFVYTVSHHHERSRIVPYHERMRVCCAFACLHSYIHVCPFLCHNICWHFLFGYNLYRAHTISEGFFRCKQFQCVCMITCIRMWMSVAEALFHFVPLDVCYYHFDYTSFVFICCCCCFCCLFVSFISYEKIEQNLRSYSTRIVILIV